MKQLGIIIHKIEFYKVYIVHIGLGQLRYFRSNDNLEIGDIVLYHRYIEEDNDGFIIDYESSIKKYNYVGNIRFDCHHSGYEQFNTYPDKMIARKKDFVIWDRENSFLRLLNRDPLDERTNSLLFKLYAENRYAPLSKEDILGIYIKAKQTVESLDIVTIINGLTIKIQNHSVTRRGSDNYLSCWTTMSSSYGYQIYGDSYFNSLFPALDVKLRSYDEKEDETTIHPDYPNPDLWEEIARQKESEMKIQALDIYSKQYSKEAHINHIVYHEISSKKYNYEDEAKYILKMKAKAETYWEGYSFEDTITQLEKTPDKFVDIIKENNADYNIDAILTRHID